MKPTLHYFILDPDVYLNNMLLFIGIFTACVAGFIYRYFYCPMPAEAREPAWKMMVLKGGFKLLGEMVV